MYMETILLIIFSIVFTVTTIQIIKLDKYIDDLNIMMIGLSIIIWAIIIYDIIQNA